MKTLINFLLRVPVALFGGYVFSQLWNWFVPRVFTSLPRIGYLDAVGLLLVASFPLLGLTLADGLKDVRERNPGLSDVSLAIMWNLIVLAIVYPLVLGLAFAWHLVIG